MGMTKTNLITMMRNIRSRELNHGMLGFRIEQDLAPVEEKDIRLFAVATRDSNSAYFTKRPIAPPFFFARLIYPMLQHLMLRKDLKLNLLRMVQAQMDTTWHRFIRAGDRLKASMEIAGIRDTPVGELLQLSGRIYSDRTLAVEAETMLLVKNRKPAAKKPIEPVSRREAFRLQLSTDAGQQLEYAAVSGDRNFIHTSRVMARMAGLPGPIMHGMCIMAMSCAALVNQLADGDLSRLSGLSGRFSHPVLPGEKLTLIGYDSPVHGEHLFNVVNPAGKLVIKNGTLKVLQASPEKTLDEEDHTGFPVERYLQAYREAAPRYYMFQA